MIKKELFKRLIISLPLLFVTAYMSAKSNVKSLDDALDDIAMEFIEAAESGEEIKLAIGEIKTLRSDKTKSESLEDYIRDTLQHKFVSKSSIKVLERSQVDALIQERDFQQSGAVKDDDWAEIGNALGAKYIIYGTGEWLSDSYKITLKMADVESQVIVIMPQEKVSARDKELKRMVGAVDSSESTKNKTKSKLTGDRIYVNGNASFYIGHGSVGSHGDDLISDYEAYSSNYSGSFNPYMSISGNLDLNVKLKYGFGIASGIGFWDGGGELIIDRSGREVYAEKYKMTALDVPVAISYQLKLFRTSLKLLGGINICMPLNCIFVYRGNGSGDKQTVSFDTKFIPGLIAGVDYIVPITKYFYINFGYRYEKDFAPFIIEYESKKYEVLNRSGSYLNAGLGIKL